MATKEQQDRVFPGDIVGDATSTLCGEGTYVRGRSIHASRIGVVAIDEGQGTPTVRVVAPTPTPAVPQCPSVASVVLGNVTRVTRTAVFVDITRVDGVAMPYSFRATLRSDEIGRSEAALPLHASFRPGDTICAEIVSIADPRQYLLSTQAPDLGVMAGTSEAGYPLETVEGRDDVMKCTHTGKLEPRWVAMA